MKKVLLLVCLSIFINSVFAQPTLSSFSPTSAKAFTPITISGTNLSGATAVRFGGNPASFFFVLSPTQITAYVEYGSSGNVSVTTPAGTASLSGFTYLPPPTLNGFSPASGGTGSAINLTGTHLTGTSSVFFGSTAAASFTVTSDTTITAIVANGSSGAVSISTPNGQAVKSGFTYTGPVITKFVPTAGGTGTAVEITGINFSAASAVNFGINAAASFIINSATSITAIVGNADSSGTISVSSPTGIATVTGFNVPSIASFTPSQGSKDSIITIRGYNFTGTSQVFFGGTAATSFSVLSDSILTARVGYGFTGSINIKNQIGTGTKQGFTYNYPAPIISSFSPATGYAGIPIVIKGSGFFSAIYVQAGTASVNAFTVVSDSIITAVVDNSASGAISVYTQGGQASLPGFSYTGPVINSFTPATGIAGTPVVIAGTNLSPVTGVSFGGIPVASFVINSANSITAIAGAGSSGDVKLSSPFGEARAYGFSIIPVISSFSPATGGIGTLVTITGTGFGSLPANNIVYFGEVRSKVVSASATQLIVEAPTGAGYEPLSVTINLLTAYSAKPFIVTSPIVVTGFTTNSFAPKQTFPVLYPGAGNYGVVGSATGDIDGDGKIDFVILKNLPPSDHTMFSFFRNKGSDSAIAFEAPVAFAQNGAPATSVAIRDMDGDGKPDVIISCEGSGTSSICLYKNTSSVGNVSFGAKLEYSVGSHVGSLVISDLDGDGKPDIIAPNGNGSTTVSILKNNTSNGFLSFLPRVNYVTGSLPYEAAAGDLNGDGKPDLAVLNSNANTLSVFKNISTIGNIAFEAKNDYPVPGGLGNIKMADVTNDDKPELVFTNSLNNTLSVLQNTSSTATISFAPRKDYNTGTEPYGLNVADLDGDGRVDIAVANNGANTISVFKNLTSGNTVSVASRINFGTGNQPRSLSIADFNGDGKPDLLRPNWVSYDASVLVNKTGMPVLLQLCPPVATTQVISAVTGVAYQWQVNDGSGFVNLVDDIHFAGTKTATLQVTGIPSSQTGFQYRCLVDGNSLDVFQLKFADSWIGTVNTSWENPGNWSCGKLPDSNTDVLINAGAVTLASNTAVRSITVKPGATLTILSGFTLTVTH